MANIKPAAKSKAPATKTRTAKQESIVKTNVKSFVNQATYAQRVREKAYELYLARNGAPGNELNDWYEAERIVSSETSKLK